MVGDRSPMPVVVGEETARIAGGKLLVIGGGHLPWHEQPGCVAAALAPWI
jgi:pimeloyl-ACP methyl ester carboxylesterase